MPGRRQRKAASVDGLFRVSLDHGASAPAGWLAGSEIETLFGAKKDVAMTGKDAPPEVKIRSYRDSPICDVVVVVHGTEMVLRCPDYRQAMRWARLERKTYKIPEPDTGFPANEESRDLPLFLRPERN